METPRWMNGVEPPAHLLRAGETQILEIECREQPQRLLDLIRAYRSDPELRSQLTNFRRLSQQPGPVMFIGMGASFCSSFSASVLLTTHGRLSFSGDAGEWLHYARPVWNDAALSGYDMGVIAAALVYVRQSFVLSTRMQEMVVSVVLIGAMSGALAGGAITDRIGRRATLLWGGAIFLCGSLLAFASPNVVILIVARFLLGVAVGFTSVTAPVYVSELAPPRSRGMLIGLSNLPSPSGSRWPTWWVTGWPTSTPGG